MDYVRIDWYDGTYEYYQNDTLCNDGIYRNAFLMYNHFQYRRIKRLQKLPKNAMCTLYHRHNKAKNDFELYKSEILT